MKILLTGASGLIGTALTAHLEKKGHQVVPLKRNAPPILTGIDAVVNLAGENVASGRWTEARKRAILESRVATTRKLSETLAPRVLVNASAIGYYGDRGEELLREESSPGKGFLADVCKAWEAATEPAQKAGVRVVCLRIGVVLSATGGALARLLTPFKLGLGGVIGSGDQWMSWIAIDDLVRIIEFALLTESLQGSVNAVAPEPVRNRTFTKALGEVVHRPTWLPLPAFAVKLLFGQMGEELLLASTRVSSEKLRRAGFVFQYPELKDALEALII